VSDALLRIVARLPDVIIGIVFLMSVIFILGLMMKEHQGQTKLTSATELDCSDCHTDALRQLASAEACARTMRGADRNQHQARSTKRLKVRLSAEMLEKANADSLDLLCSIGRAD
jgi:hypothetical protein